jgi:hypothetical protein
MRIRHYSLARLFLKRILATLLVCALRFFSLLILPYTDQLVEQYATVAVQGDRTLTDADGADFTIKSSNSTWLNNQFGVSMP